MDVVRGCAECLRLAEAYEAETMTWFRQEGQLRIAEYGRDEESATRITRELDATTRRRTGLRVAMETHHQAFHRGAQQAFPGAAGA